MGESHPQRGAVRPQAGLVDTVTSVTQSKFPQHRCRGTRQPRRGGLWRLSLGPRAEVRPTGPGGPRGLLGSKSRWDDTESWLFTSAGPWSLFGHVLFYKQNTVPSGMPSGRGFAQSSFLGGWVWVRATSHVASASLDLVESLPPGVGSPAAPRQAGASGTGRCEFWPGRGQA